MIRDAKCQECTTHHPSLLDDPVKRTYDTHDLLREHPTKKGYYKIVGRTDDQIMMAYVFSLIGVVEN